MKIASTLAAALLGGALAALAPSTAHADNGDTVFLQNGGRVRGSVIEDDPSTGVKIRLIDGTVRTIARKEISNVTYEDAAPKPAAAPPATPPPATAAPVSTDPWGAPASSSPGGARPVFHDSGETKGIAGLYIAGPILLGVTWITTIAVTTAVSKGDLQGEAIGYSAIPLVGPFAMIANKELNTKSYTGGLVASGVLQWTGLTMMVLGLAIRTPVRHVTALNHVDVMPVASPKYAGLSLTITE